MGTAHVSIGHALYEELVSLKPVLPMLNILRATDFGDGTMLLLVESTALADGYHGVQELIFTKTATPNSFTVVVRFKMDVDV